MSKRSAARVMRTFGRACAIRRVALGLTCRDVSDATGVAASVVNRVECHTVQPSFYAALRLAGFYRLSLKRFVTEAWL